MQVRKVAEENGVDVSGQIRELEDRAKQVSMSSLPELQRHCLLSILPSKAATVAGDKCVLDP